MVIGGFGKRIIEWVKSKSFTTTQKKKINRALRTWKTYDADLPITNLKSTGKLNSHKLVDKFLLYLLYISLVYFILINMQDFPCFEKLRNVLYSYWIVKRELNRESYSDNDIENLWKHIIA